MAQPHRGLLLGGLLLLLMGLLWSRFGGPGSIEVALGFALLFGLGTLLLLAGMQRKRTLAQRLPGALAGYLLVGLLVAALQVGARAGPPAGREGGGVPSFIGAVLLWPVHLTDWLPIAPDLRPPP